MRLSAIIVSYNVRYYVQQCLLSLYRAAKDIEMEVFVVDNASTDDTISYLSSCFPRDVYPTLHLMVNAVNVGFGRANNMALEQSQGEYVLFINPDTFVTETTLMSCISFCESHQNVGAVGVRMLKPDGTFAPESRRGYPSPFTSLCKVVGLNKLFPRSKIFGRYYMQYQDEHQPCEIDIVSGAFMMVPHKVLDITGGFDTDFFMYGEDIDLSYRIQKNGFRNWYVPVPVLHYKGESTEKSSYRYVYVFYEAMLIFFNKHYHNMGWLYTLPIKCAIYFLAIKTYIQLQISQLTSRAHAWNTEPQTKCLFVGSPKMLEQARKLCQNWMIKADFILGDTNTFGKMEHEMHTAKGHYQLIVYDMESFTFDKVLENMDATPTKGLQVGTYYKENQMMLTCKKVYKL